MIRDSGSLGHFLHSKLWVAQGGLLEIIGYVIRIHPHNTITLLGTSTGDSTVVCRKCGSKQVIPGCPGPHGQHNGVRAPPRLFIEADQDHLGNLRGKPPAH